MSRTLSVKFFILTNCISFVIINNSASCYLTTFSGIFKAETAKNPPKLGQKSYHKFSCILHDYKVKQSMNYPGYQMTHHTEPKNH